MKTEKPMEQNKQLFFTSDGLSFFDATKANSHAKKLADKTITERSQAAVDAATAAIIGADWQRDILEDEY